MRCMLKSYELDSCANPYYLSDGNYLPFLEFANNTERVTLPSALDSKSSILTIPIASSFGSTNVTSLSVSHWKEASNCMVLLV